MANVDEIAKLRGISVIEAIEYWNKVCDAAGIKLTTYEVLTVLQAQGVCAASITADQLFEKKKALEREKRKREKELQATEAARLKELADKRVGQKSAEIQNRKSIVEASTTKDRALEDEFRELVAEMSAIGFTHSSQVSEYITRNRLGNKYKNISGKLEMIMEDNVWDFDGGFPPKIYARLCKELGLRNQGSKAVPGKFTPYKDIYKN